MNLDQREQINASERKKAPLTDSEALRFFFMPYNIFGGENPSKIAEQTAFNKSDIERFRKHGFDTKLKQAKMLRIYGFIFYFGIGAIMGYLISRLV